MAVENFEKEGKTAANVIIASGIRLSLHVRDLTIRNLDSLIDFL